MGFFDGVPKWKMVVAEAIHLWGEEGIGVKNNDGEIVVKIDVDKKVKLFLCFDESNNGAEIAAILFPYQGRNASLFRETLVNILNQSPGYHIEFMDHGRTPIIEWRYTGSSTNNHFSARICVEGCAKFIEAFYEIIEPEAYME